MEQSPFLDGQGRVFSDEPKAPKPRTWTPSLPPPPSLPTEEQLRYIEQHYSSSPAPVFSTQTMEAAAAAELVHEVRGSAADGQGGVRTGDWAANYDKCPTFGTLWRQTGDAQADALLYPEGVRVLGDMMYLHGKLCVPQPLELEYMLEHHYLQHASVNKQDTDLKRRTHIKNTRQKIADIRRHCEIC